MIYKKGKLYANPYIVYQRLRKITKTTFGRSEPVRKQKKNNKNYTSSKQLQDWKTSNET
jgi:hypothetical protein